MIYHLSTELSKIIPVFTPRIPERTRRMEGENGDIPRICVAKTIEDCLSAMPDGGYSLEESEKPIIIRVYEFDEETIDPENLISPSHLYLSGWVLDSWVTGECWVVRQNIFPVRCYDICLNYFDVYNAPFVHPQEFLEKSLVYREPEVLLEELEKDAEQYIARVKNLQYTVLREFQITDLGRKCLY